MDAREQPKRSTEAAVATTTFPLGNPATFFGANIIPTDVVRGIIDPMLMTFTPNGLLTLMAGMDGAAGHEITNHFGYGDLEKILLQAIIDDNREAVKLMLDKKSSLLLNQRHTDIIVQSKYTWRIFKILPTENPLAIAVKRKQIEMIKLLVPYYESLEKNPALSEAAKQAKEAGLKAWSFYETKKNGPNKDEIVIPKEYISFINSLIDTFVCENVRPRQTDFTHLSDNVENAMRSLLNLLVPKTAVELDNYIDVELLLLAAYRLYNQRFYHFTSWKQRDAFCIRVIGLIQSARSPETAKIFCENPYDVAKENRVVGPRAASLKLNDDKSFYRADRESLSDLGGKYFCGGAGCLLFIAPDGEERFLDESRFSKLMSKNNIRLSVYYAAKCLLTSVSSR